MKTLKKSAKFIMRLFKEMLKFSIESANNQQRSGKISAGNRQRDGDKRAGTMCTAGTNQKLELAIDVKGIEETNRIFRKARSPPRKRGKEQQKSF